MTTVSRKLWRGEYPLWVAFWLFYVLGYLVSFGLVASIAPLFHTQPWRGLVVFLLIVPYNVVSTVGAWRSANSYPLTRWWPRLAQACVVLWDTRLAWSMANGVMVTITETLSS